MSRLYFTFLLEWRKRSSSNNEGLVKKSRQRAVKREEEEVEMRSEILKEVAERLSDMIFTFLFIKMVLKCTFKRTIVTNCNLLTKQRILTRKPSVSFIYHF